MASTEAPPNVGDRYTLAEIYEELGVILLSRGRDLNSGGQTAQAKSRYIEAAQAFLKSLREGGNLKSIGLAISHSQEAEPNNLFVLNELGEALWRSGQVAAAIDILEHAVCRADRAHLREHSVDVRITLGKAFADVGRYNQALKTLRQGIAIAKSQQAELWTALANARLKVGRPNGAIRAADHVIDLNEQHAARQEAMKIKAAALLEQHHYGASNTVADMALDLDPRDLVTARIKGRALIEGRIDIDEGIRLIQRYVDWSPHDTEYRLFLADNLRSHARDPTGSIRVLQAGLEIEKADKPVALYLDLADTYVATGQIESALTLLERPDVEEAGKSKSLARWFQIHGDVLRMQGNAAAALDDYVKAVELDPDDGPLKLNLSLVARSTGDYVRAWRTVGEAIETGLNKDHRTNAFVLQAELAEALRRPRDEIVAACYEAGRNLYWQDEYKRSLFFFRRVMKLDHEHSGARWYAADAALLQAFRPVAPYWDLDQLKEARDLWKTAFRFGSPTAEYAWAYLSGARIAGYLGNLCPASQSAPLICEAVAFLERSLVLDDTKMSVWMELARLYRLMNNLGNALMAADRAVLIDKASLDAMDERIAVLVIQGQVTQARESINKRLMHERTAWVDKAHAYVLYLESLEQPDGQKKDLESLEAAIKQLAAVIGADDDDVWARSLRAEWLRRLALRVPNRADDCRKRAQDDYKNIWSRREEPAFVGQERILATAAYGLGEVQQALKIREPLIGDPMDPSRGDYRDCGCCYLRLGKFEKAEEYLNRGIDHAVTLQELEELDVQLTEIEQATADGINREQMLALLKRVRARVNSARVRVKAAPSAREELCRFIGWEEARRRTDDWSWIAANAGLARLYLEADELRRAETIYRTLGQHAERFPEAGAGLARIVTRCRELGEAALTKGWDKPEAQPVAIEHFEHALEIEKDNSGSDRGGLYVRLAIAQYQARMAERAAETFAAAAMAFKAAGEVAPGITLAKTCQTFLPDVDRYWALDAYLRQLVHDPSTPEALRSVLPQTIEQLGEYLSTVVEHAVEDDEALAPMVMPIVLEVSGNLAPKEGEDQQWPLLMEYIPEMRERIEDETGVRIPGVRIRGSEADLPDDTYVIMVDEVRVATGSISSSAGFSPSPASALEAAGIAVTELKEATHPLSKQPGWWIPQKYWDRIAGDQGCILWRDPMQFIVAHLEAVLRNNLSNLFGIQETQDLLERWARTDTQHALIERALPDTLVRDRFVRVLRALIYERVSIAAFETILEAIGQIGLASDDIGEAIRTVRRALKADLPGNRPGMKLITVLPEIERTILPWVFTGDGRRFFAIPREETGELLTRIRKLVQRDDPATVLVAENADLRDPLRRLVEIEFPNVTVQSREETLGKEDREAPLAWIPLIAEWEDLWPRSMETSHAD